MRLERWGRAGLGGGDRQWHDQVILARGMESWRGYRRGRREARERASGSCPKEEPRCSLRCGGWAGWLRGAVRHM